MVTGFWCVTTVLQRGPGALLDEVPDVAGEAGDVKDRLFKRIEPLFDVRAFADLSVLIAGCGSGGGQVAQHLAMSGMRKFVLVDRDELEVENVIRHVCGLRYLGRRKTAALAHAVRDRNPRVRIRLFDEDALEWTQLEDEVGRADVVVVATDNEASRYRLNEVSVRTRTPFTVGRVFTRGIGGEAFAYRPRDGGCLEQVLDRTQFRDGVREVDLVSEEDWQRVYDLGVEEIRDSPGLSVDIAFIAAFHTRFTLDQLGGAAASRPWFMTPIVEN